MQYKPPRLIFFVCANTFYKNIVSLSYKGGDGNLVNLGNN